MTDILYTPKQVAARYGVAERTLTRWRTDGAGPRYIRIGLRKIRYRAADCAEYDRSRSYSHRANELTQAA